MDEIYTEAHSVDPPPNFLQAHSVPFNKENTRMVKIGDVRMLRLSITCGLMHVPMMISVARIKMKRTLVFLFFNTSDISSSRYFPNKT